jgi:hypothetical protein
VKWQEPWSPDKVGEDSERVTINLYNSRSEACQRQLEMPIVLPQIKILL